MYSNYLRNIATHPKQETLSCNCRNKNGCPLNGNCRTENVIYKCTSLTKSNVKKVYLGVSEGELKKKKKSVLQPSAIVPKRKL